MGCFLEKPVVFCTAEIEVMSCRRGEMPGKELFEAQKRR